MISVADALLFLVPALYAAAAAVSILLFVRPESGARRLARPLLFAAVVAHGVEIALRAAVARRCPLGTLAETTGLTAFALAGTYTVLSLRSGRRPTGVLIVPLSCALVLAYVLTRREAGAVNPALASPWFSLHAASAVLAVAALAVSFVHGVFYLLLYREIKAHRFGLLFRRLPPLAVLSRMTNIAAVSGFSFLTVTLAAGTAWGLRSGHAGAMLRDPMFLLSAGAWLLYAAGLAVRYLAGFRGRYTVLLSVFAFSLLILSMTAVFLLFPALHVYR
ncbi:MAG: cytochrome c biogenesis protein [Planctomycetes bacterium]|nr:cytochrome c biogenesis protein [Planctomycetota bacterium]